MGGQGSATQGRRPRARKYPTSFLYFQRLAGPRRELIAPPGRHRPGARVGQPAKDLERAGCWARGAAREAFERGAARAAARG